MIAVHGLCIAVCSFLKKLFWSGLHISNTTSEGIPLELAKDRTPRDPCCGFSVSKTKVFLRCLKGFPSGYLFFTAKCPLFPKGFLFFSQTFHQFSEDVHPRLSFY